MIAYLFLVLGAAGTAGVIYAVVPTSRGLHRYVVPRAQLRAEAERSDEAATELECKLIGLASEYEAVVAERDNALAALEKAGRQIVELEEQLLDADQLRQTNTALKAELANTRAVSALPPHGSTPPPPPRAVPLHQAPFALSPKLTSN